MGQITIDNEDTYKTFIPPVVEHYQSNRKRIKSVRLKMISHDEVYAKLKAEGRQIDITNPDFEIGKTGRKTIDGIFSPMFGPDSDNDAPVFSCPCHKTTGSARLGHICPYCGEEVRSIEADLRLVGHIDIYPYYVMTWHGVKALSSVIKRIESVYTTVPKIDNKGNLVKGDKLSIMDIYERYDDEFYEKTGLEKKYAFCSKIPVFSSRLRPWIKNNTSVSVLKVNTLYNSIVTMRRDLLSISGLRGDLQIWKTLNQIQQDFLGVCKHITDQIGGKTGIIRRFMAAGRVDYSARMVIKLGQDLMPHEIRIPYQTAMVLYEEDIVNRYSRVMKCSVAEALRQYRMASYYYDKTFASIITGMLNSGNGVWALINRNPTINEMGTPFMRIKAIHDTYDDYTMEVPPDVLTPMAADLTKAKTSLAQSRSATRVISYKNKRVNA